MSTAGTAPTHADPRAGSSAARALRTLVVGCGGLGSPSARVLFGASVLKRLTLLDDDRVDVSNLHRQTLYSDPDVGRDKVDAAVASLRAEHPASRTELTGVRARLRPADAEALLADQDLVVEGADNYATKFLTADAARLRGVPVAHAGAVRWAGWALLSAPHADVGPCLRCVFEDIPRGRADTCATAGVMGPVVGVVAALQSALVLAYAGGDERAIGTLFHYDALAGKLRRFQA
ncbi:MAG: ThiF family adenylyltransferase, partial [Myxococcales bacterium]|nr:ThiF family adenylyltransferase [Myxococcales bacterium]